MRYRLHPAVSALLEDFPFHPDYVLESRWRQFLFRGAAALVVIVAAYAPILTSRLLWEDSSEGAAEVWRHSSTGGNDVARMDGSTPEHPWYGPQSQVALPLPDVVDTAARGLL